MTFQICSRPWKNCTDISSSVLFCLQHRQNAPFTNWTIHKNAKTRTLASKVMLTCDKLWLKPNVWITQGSWSSAVKSECLFWPPTHAPIQAWPPISFSGELCLRGEAKVSPDVEIKGGEEAFEPWVEKELCGIVSDAHIAPPTMAIPSTGWRGDKGGRRGSPVPMSGSPSEEDEGPPPTQRSALDPRTSSDHRRPYSPVAETVGSSTFMNHPSPFWIVWIWSVIAPCLVFPAGMIRESRRT